MAKRAQRKHLTRKRIWPEDPTARQAFKREVDRQYQIELRNAIFSNYGKSCACCHESEPEFLNLDHISDGGNEERAKHGGGRNLWLELRRRRFPVGYQVLCANCNQAKRNGKVCPHQKMKINGSTDPNN